MFGEKLRQLRRNKGLTQNELAQALHVSNGTVAMWETNKRQPDIQTLSAIASFFKISSDSLMGIDSNLSSLTLDRDVVRIPVYGTIPAGYPIDMIDDGFIEDYEEIPASWTKNGQKYGGLKVRGDSMFPEFRDGDTIILKKVDDCESGAYCAVSINHTECTFKKVVKSEKGITLQPLNPAYTPLFFTHKEADELPVAIIGVVKEVRRSY